LIAKIISWIAGLAGTIAASVVGMQKLGITLRRNKK